MFSAIQIVEDVPIAGEMLYLAAESKQVSIDSTQTQYPQSFEVKRLTSTFNPEIVFLELTAWERVVSLVEAIRAYSPDTAIVGIGGEWWRRAADKCKEAGIDDLLVTPLSLEKVRESVRRAIQALRSEPRKNLLVFLPAKAGSGSTTVALNTAGCLANAMSKKVLLAEADLKSGVLATLLNAAGEHPLVDVLEQAASLDYTVFSKHVIRLFSIDLLLSNPKKAALPSWVDYHQFLRFVLPRYDAVVVDLPEVVNEATAEVVRCAGGVFVVCTPEVPSLTLAKERCRELESHGVPKEHIWIIVNRWHGADMKAAEVEDLLKHPVTAVLPNDYKAVHRATMDCGLVAGDTKLGRAFRAFADKLAATPPEPEDKRQVELFEEPPPPKPKSGFMEAFGFGKSKPTS